jgi:hypothetical protein
MSERRSGWSREFEEPIALPGGGKLVVFRDAAKYITALPANEAALPKWQAAIEALILVVELGGPTMFTRVGVMRALNRGRVREFTQSGKQHRLGAEKAQERPMTVFVYVNTSKQVGDRELSANQDAAETWLQENDPEGVAFEYEVLE